MPADPSAGFFDNLAGIADDVGAWLTQPSLFQRDASGRVVTDVPHNDAAAVGDFVSANLVQPVAAELADVGTAAGQVAASNAAPVIGAAVQLAAWGGALLVGAYVLQRLERR